MPKQPSGCLPSDCNLGTDEASMYYGKVKVVFHEPQSYKDTGLLAVASLEAEMCDRGEIVKIHKRELLKFPDGRRAFESWWNLAEAEGAIGSDA